MTIRKIIKTTKRLGKKVSRKTKNPESKLKQNWLKYLRKKKREISGENYDPIGLNTIEKLISHIESIKNWSYENEIPHEWKDPQLDALIHKISVKSEIYSKLEEIFFNGDE